MAITPQHQKSEPDETDLEHAYNRARSIGLFLVEKYARGLIRDNADMKLHEFIMSNGDYYFLTESEQVVHVNEGSSLARLMRTWNVSLALALEPMRFTATGPIRREW